MDDTLPLRILQSTQLMTNLRSLALDLRGLSPAQVDSLVLAMPIGHKWERISHLKIFAVDDLTLAAVTHCVGGTLEALSINVDTDSLAYKKAVKDHRGLKRLHVVGTIPGPGERFSAKAVWSAARSFKNLEWLSVSCGSRDFMNGRRLEDEDLPLFVSTIRPYRLPFSHSHPWKIHEQRLTMIQNRSNMPDIWWPRSRQCQS